MQAEIHNTLAAAANRGGGWPYYTGKASRIEPTCWALLALQGAWSGDAAAFARFAEPHLAWLSAARRGDALLVDHRGAPPNFTANGLAVCALGVLGDTAAAIRRDLVSALVAVKGVSVDNRDPRQDSRLQGWPWMPDTFSWVEPTCWCVLALKKAGGGAASARARIDEAERLIVNRTCEPGGWNYGNASVIGQDLRPYVPTTALGLIALQDRRDVPAVRASLAWLQPARLKEPSAMALALASIALRIHGAPTDDVDRGMEEDEPRAAAGSVQALAMMLYSLTAEQHGLKALTV